MPSLRGPRWSGAAPAPEQPKPSEPPPGVVLIRIDGGRRVYQCVGGWRVEVPDAGLFRRYGFEWHWVQDVSADDPLAQLPLLGSGSGTPSPPAPTPKKRAKPKAAKEPRFRTFEEYLALATTDPNLIRSPFSEEDRRILAYMAYLKDRLAQEHRDLPQDELVSIIIPTFERAGVIEQAVRSALAQSYENIEVIVVDDASLDGTEAVVKAIDDPRVTYIRRRENGGNAHARNTGLRAARGAWVGYLDSDDVWDEHFVRILLGELKRAGASFGYSAQLVLRPLAEGESERQNIIRFAPFHRGLLENNNFISMISVLHRRSLLDEVGLLDEGMRRYVDWEFFLRLSAASPPIAVPVILSTYDQSESASNVSRGESRAVHLELIRRRLREGRELGPLLSDVPASSDVADLLDIAFCNAGQPEPVNGAPGVTIVIPSYEAAPFLRACTASIRRFSPPGTHLVIVDNASGEEVQEHLDELDGQDGVTVVRNDVNYGFTYAVNQGIALAHPEHDIVIMNNDALATPGWLEGLQRVTVERDDVGIVAPRQVLPPDTSTIRTHVPGSDPTRECDSNLSAHHRNVIDPNFDVARGWVELTYAPFFCVLVTRKALDLCGPLDHVNAPHYRSDRVYCDAVRSHAGLRIIYTAESKLYHFHQRATYDLRDTDANLFKAMRTSEEWTNIMALQAAREAAAKPSGA